MIWARRRREPAVRRRRTSTPVGYYVTIASQSIEIDWDEHERGYRDLIEGFHVGAVDQVERSISRIFGLAANVASLDA